MVNHVGEPRVNGWLAFRLSCIPHSLTDARKEPQIVPKNCPNGTLEITGAPQGKAVNAHITSQRAQSHQQEIKRTLENYRMKNGRLNAGWRRGKPGRISLEGIIDGQGSQRISHFIANDAAM